LRLDVEPPQRLDHVVEELDPHGLVPVGGEHVQEPAAAGKLAGQLDGRGGVEAALDEPSQQRADVDSLADAQATAAGRQPLAAGRGLQQALDAGRDQAWQAAIRANGGLGRGRWWLSLVAFANQLLQRPQPVGVDFVMQNPFAGVGFPSRKAGGGDRREQRKVVAESVDAVLVRTDDDQRSGRRAHQFGRDQRARRSPDSV
jgi:hypothetical protein